MTPIGERVILKKLEKAERTQGGLYIPDNAKEEKKEGIVQSVGQKDGKDLPLKKGDHVLYGGYDNEDIEIGNEKFVIVEFKNILAKF
ncbi:MAG: co-chaperone GroES [archaeon]